MHYCAYKRSSNPFNIPCPVSLAHKNLAYFQLRLPNSTEKKTSENFHIKPLTNFCANFIFRPELLPSVYSYFELNFRTKYEVESKKSWANGWIFYQKIFLLDDKKYRWVEYSIFHFGYPIHNKSYMRAGEFNYEKVKSIIVLIRAREPFAVSGLLVDSEKGRVIKTFGPSMEVRKGSVRVPDDCYVQAHGNPLILWTNMGWKLVMGIIVMSNNRINNDWNILP